jgi:hypothetical protein
MAKQGEDNKLLSRPPEIVKHGSAESQTPAAPPTNPPEVRAGIPAAIGSVAQPPEKRRWRPRLLVAIAALCCVVVALIIHFKSWLSDPSQSLSGTVVDSVGANLP